MPAATPELNRASTRIHYWADTLNLDIIRNKGSWTLIDPQGPELLAYRLDSPEMEDFLARMRDRGAQAS